MNGAQARELLDGALFAYLQVAVATSQPPEWIQTAVLLEAEALYPKRETPPFADDVSDARKLLDTVRGMGALPASARRALQLRVREGWSFEAIAEELEVSVKYARHLVVSSMAKLRSWRRHELEQER
ncbi:MAG TPA: sigma factor-like helix-turn-helix DNA-binding protein [Thermoanaerobaculia bacterium]